MWNAHSKIIMASQGCDKEKARADSQRLENHNNNGE
jgi:hypothetical protein